MALARILSQVSTEYLEVEVIFDSDGVSADPTGDVVEFSFPPGGTLPAVWFAGTWETFQAQGVGAVARILVGPGGGAASFTPGTYGLWIRIFDDVESPVFDVGSFTVT